MPPRLEEVSGREMGAKWPGQILVSCATVSSSGRELEATPPGTLFLSPVPTIAQDGPSL